MSTPSWSTKDIPDLTGKVAIVTGANSGIGFEAALEFARHGAHVIMACRNMEKAHAAQLKLEQEVANAHVEVMALDLADLSSVKAFAKAFMEGHDRLDILLNNAGIMMVPYGTTKDGFERQNGTNHLGHFALTGHLLPHIKKTPGARVVNISSNGHKAGKMDFENLLYEGGKGYTPIKSYCRSKLANLLFTFALQRRFDEHGVDAMALAAHPGGSDTNLAAHLEKNFLFRVLKPIFYLFVQSAAMGALPGIRASIDPDAKGGQYYGPSGFQELKGYPKVVNAKEQAYNNADGERLWDVSEELTGVTYSW